MKPQIAELLSTVVATLKSQDVIPAELEPRINVENTRDKAHGDLATNLAMMLAKPAKKNPRELAQLIVDALPESELVENVEIAGPGFINFYLSDASTNSLIKAVLEQKEQYGRSDEGAGRKVQVSLFLPTQLALCILVTVVVPLWVTVYVACWMPMAGM